MIWEKAGHPAKRHDLSCMSEPEASSLAGRGDRGGRMPFGAIVIMIARIVAILLFVAPGSALAGIEAVYVRGLGPSIELTIADNGDLNADLGARRKLVRRGGQVWLVQDRLTGPIVNRIEDLEAAAGNQTREAADGPLASIGPAEVRGRSGEGFVFTNWGVEQKKAFLVLSPDPGLRPLSAALKLIWRTEALLFVLANPTADHAPLSEGRTMARLLEGRAPLRFGDLELKDLRRGEVRLTPFALAGAAETREELRRRLERERLEEPMRNSHVSRALFAEGRLWLVTDDGALTSLAQGERSRRPEDAGAPVVDICVGTGGLRVLTGDGGRERRWTLRRWNAGRWTVERSGTAEGESIVAFSCAGAEAILLTDKRLVEAGPAGEKSRALSGEAGHARVKAVTLETPAHLFVGLNSGEWGGGLIRIDRKSGEVRRIERNSTGDLCDGPLNTACDPVHGIAVIPWKPDCVAAAVGLVHMLGHGRIVEICGERVDQIFAQSSDRHSDAADAALGGYGSVPFFGLAAAGGTLLAAGHDGLYRLGPAGLAEHRPWPRFEEIDGLLVSFALPDAVLVITTINGRASLGGGAPLLVTR